ncbi:UNVERIFIED_CONTAM: hypothetical protein GTU68_059163 [Idotea baltica]|nr:hypothetical protein [Idotea baltica]
MHLQRYCRRNRISATYNFTTPKGAKKHRPNSRRN